MKSQADILFCSSSPANADHLELDREARTIQRAIEDVDPENTAPLRVMTRWAAEPLDLLREIRAVRPTVLHFAGYGARGTEIGIYLRDPISGEAKLVGAQALKATIQAAGSSIRIVVFSACYTEVQAAGLLEIETLNCVIGINSAISETDIREFAHEFYCALAGGRSVYDAWRRGNQPLEMRGIPEHHCPQLRERPGSDARRVFVCHG